MTVRTTTNRKDYIGDGSLTTFPYDFKIFEKTDLQVYVNEVLKTVDTDYTVTGAGSETGGNVVFVPGAAPGPDVPILIIRTIPIVQETSWVDHGPDPAGAIEDAADRLTMVDQQLMEYLDRIIKVPVTSSVKALEIPVVPAGVPRWNTAGDSFECVALASGDTANVIIEQGDLIVGGASAIPQAIHHGSAGQAMSTGGHGALPAWAGMTTQGDTEYHNGTGRARLPAGTAGQKKKTGGPGQNPYWANDASRVRITADAMASKIATGYALYEWTEGTNFFWGHMKFDAQNEVAYLPPFRITNWNAGNITVRIGYKSSVTSGQVQFKVSFKGCDTAIPETFDSAMTDHTISPQTVPGQIEKLSEIVWTGAVSELAANDLVLGKLTRIDAPGPLDAKVLYVEIEYQEA
jgi:hypothetical protein